MWQKDSAEIKLVEEEWSTVLTLQNNRISITGDRGQKGGAGFVTHYTGGGPVQDMPSHPFLDGPSSWEGSRDGANQNWTQRYLKEARNPCHSPPAGLFTRTD